ncbi:tRNA (adenosine(37)-N6)-threonylcarbamoyltransferase complex dimerization subunit type 1 TsaB [Marinicauda sp. Alg238-R41]|uniref:tRNA (adenosine(37)-N6)-threonylcarbamoyltransferase complex dimerization subunit type 1 TsaB n=1 Tax=Marinicauda sp. Alg238-R41 TaxID=2993447 RepID=UPI0022E47CFE|nr:tRNA (adenosine(37)-N6)-threonylcarbamoyltransferase complex dimerization subunit type 1 TsaB [Marinicauda sp. Alg238-R41]
MTVLVIDTTGPWCAAGLVGPDAAWHEAGEPIGRGHAERLAPMVQALLKQAGIVPGALDRIGVATGPGSFAGTRVGVAFARGLALATGAKALGISSLQAWARRADPDRHWSVAAIHDARRGDLLWQVFTDGAPVSRVERGGVEDARVALSAYGDIHMTGSGAVLLGADPAHFIVEPPLKALSALTGEASHDAPPPAPLYARPPDAKLPGGRDPEPVA